MGTILGGSLAILWVMLKLSRAMVGHVEAICQMLFGHVVGFVSQSALGFGELCFIHVGVKCKDQSNILGPHWGQVWPSWALSRYLEATALLHAAKLGDLESKFLQPMLVQFWGQGRLPYGHAGAILGFGDFGAQAVWDHFGPRYECGYHGDPGRQQAGRYVC